MKRKTLLITGGAGFIGSHLCDRFTEDDLNVICVDNFVTGDAKNIHHLLKHKNFRFLRCDISKKITVAGPVDYLLHFASPASPVDYLNLPLETLQVGSQGTLNALELAKSKKSVFLFSSTSEVYGDPLVHPQKETYWGNVNPIGPRSVYDEAKRFSEALTMAYRRSYRVNTKILRIFNTYGPRMRVNDGRVVPNFVDQALHHKPLTVYGNGKQTRSFCYVSDMVEGIARLLYSSHSGPINIGNPKEFTILEFARMVCKISGTKSKIIYKPLPIDDPKQRRPDITLAKALLKWEPKIELEECLRKFFAWFISILRMSQETPSYSFGISAFYHDSAACLVKDGEIIAAAQEERFTRKKHDASFPANAIQYCLKEANIKTSDLNFVGFYEKPFIKFERLLYTYLTYAPFGLRSFLKAMPLWIKEKIFIKDLIASELEFKGEIIFPEHHESHAASAFYPSPFSKAAILTMDGVGEWTTTSFGAGNGNQFDLQYEMKFPHSLGLLYSAFTYYVGFRVNSGEYKLMGLAPYGEPKYVDLIKKELVDIKSDGSFKLNMKYFDYCAGLTMTNAKFHKLFGAPPRKPESAITQRDMDVARSIQEVTEEIMLKIANHVHEVTKEENLCLAGGVALNCVGNGRILKEGKFKNIWIQPAAGDAGGALGAALFIWYRYLNNPRRSDNVTDQQKGSLLGPSFKMEIEEFIKAGNIPAQKFELSMLSKKIAELIKDEKVIGLFQGRMEFGPRALGARSIIGDARSEKMQSIMNLKIKFRESFRPFAPSVLEEKASDYFDCSAKSPYMLLVASVNKDKIVAHSNGALKGIDRLLKAKRSVIPAVTHVDNSARLQTVSDKNHPIFYGVIKAFDELTQCPVIINTSFNVRGEPIVCTPEDAYRCFMCTGMDYLVLGEYLLKKENQPRAHAYKKEDISVELD